MKKPAGDTAIAILRWLADMCAPNPADTFNTAHSIEERVWWLDRPERPWLPVDAGSRREPWLLADAGMVELQHRGPSVMRLTTKGVSASCFPALRLTARGAHWCRLALVTEDAAERTALGEIIAQALVRPGEMAKVWADAVSHFPAFAVPEESAKIGA